MLHRWKTLSTQLAFDNPWFKVRQDVVQLPSGQVMDDYFMWENKEVVMVVAVTPENSLVLVRQYKHAQKDFMVEFPAGYVEGDEDIKLAAQRELEEETGYRTDALEPLAVLVNNPTKEIGKIHVFLARNAVRSDVQRLDASEEIEVNEYTPDQIETMIHDGTIVTTGTISAFTLARKRLGL